ncbi:MAG TPA: phosphatase PAP2 family protein, partial [Bacteroidota bacterium]|nr:phosphatase PAP2 family protein [Bacteroidota bacterium]
YDAFPSGHICTSMATVVVIAENYPEVTWVRPLGYLFCTVIAVGMVNNGIHWYSDYPLGIFLGYSFGMIASHQELFTLVGQSDPGRMNVSLAPSISRYGPGLLVSVSF